MPRLPSPSGVRFDWFRSHEQCTENNVNCRPVRPMTEEIATPELDRRTSDPSAPQEGSDVGLSRVFERQNIFVWKVSAFNELNSRDPVSNIRRIGLQMFFDVLNELNSLVAISKCATLKGDSGRFAGGSVPRGVNNFLAHRRC